MTRTLLATMAAVEIATGAALLAAPGFVATLLLGATLDTSAAQVVARVAGAALLALGVACWLARGDGAERTGRSTFLAMLVYNGAAAAVLAYAAVGAGLQSLLLWPTIVLHAALAAWCALSLRPLVRGPA